MEADEFTYAEHTLIVSDIHLADTEPVRPDNPLWKIFKRPEHFVDQSFKTFLDTMRSKIATPLELVLNGDIFDFDSVMAIPKNPHFKVHWMESLRGLNSEELKSRFKMQLILESHPVWIQSLRDLVNAGGRVVFVIGNHDIELHWPSVRQDLLNHLDLAEDQKNRVRFCEWFYISNQDTLVEHGNQYDAYCLCSNPIHPLIKKGSSIQVRLPFGNLAGKYMVNGMGLMNPHATSSYIKDSALEYFQFYFKYMFRTQPFLAWTWFWSAMYTLTVSLIEGFLPALSDPLTVHSRIEDIARRSNTSALAVLSLKEAHVHPAIFNPLKILRELWLDRAILLALVVVGSFQFFTLASVFSHVSLLWFMGPLLVLLPAFVFYARSVQSGVNDAQMAAVAMAPLIARIAHVRRVVHGHTHLEMHTVVDGVEVLNTGTWSPAYHDVECTQPYGRKCFAWIQPDSTYSQRFSQLYEWTGNEAVLIEELRVRQTESSTAE